MSESPVVEGRKCGDCRLCCKALEVDLGEKGTSPKPRGTWCQYACDRGCSIYEERPQNCRTFTCLWIGGAFGEEHRPDKTGLVPLPAGDGSNVVRIVDPLTKRDHIALVLHEGQLGAADRPAGKAFIAALTSKGFAVQLANVKRVYEVRYPSGFVRIVSEQDGVLL